MDRGNDTNGRNIHPTGRHGRFPADDAGVENRIDRAITLYNRHKAAQEALENHIAQAQDREDELSAEVQICWYDFSQEIASWIAPGEGFSSREEVHGLDPEKAAVSG